MKSFRDIRVIPVVLVAIFGLAILKVAGLVIDGGYVFDYQPKATQKSWAQESFNFPGGGPKVSKVESDDITGSVHGAPEKKKGSTLCRVSNFLPSTNQERCTSSGMRSTRLTVRYWKNWRNGDTIATNVIPK